MSDEIDSVVVEEQVEKLPETIESGEGDAKPESEEQPEVKPGTPDKVLQKMQQELGNVTRQIAALAEKKEAEGQLSEADRAKLQKSQQRLEQIRSYVDDPIAEHVIELTDRVSEVDRLKAENEDFRKRLTSLEVDRTWERVKTKYDGLDTDAIWEKAQNDAREDLGDEATPKAVNRIASKYFDSRCEAAKKRLKEEPKKDAKTDPPANYKVGTGQRTAPVLSDEDELLATARSLVREI